MISVQMRRAVSWKSGAGFTESGALSALWHRFSSSGRRLVETHRRVGSEQDTHTLRLAAGMGNTRYRMYATNVAMPNRTSVTAAELISPRPM